MEEERERQREREKEAVSAFFQVEWSLAPH